VGAASSPVVGAASFPGVGTAWPGMGEVLQTFQGEGGTPDQGGQADQGGSLLLGSQLEEQSPLQHRNLGGLPVLPVETGRVPWVVRSLGYLLLLVRIQKCFLFTNQLINDYCLEVVYY